MPAGKQSPTGRDSRLFHILPASRPDSPGRRPPPSDSANRLSRRLASLLILLVGAVVPAWIAGLSAPPPRTREIHIEAYRYGFSQARIQVNRGDRLQLTFSTRDTGQSFFLQDYGLNVSITPGQRQVLLQRLAGPADPPVLDDVVEIDAGLPGWRGCSSRNRPSRTIPTTAHCTEPSAET